MRIVLSDTLDVTEERIDASKLAFTNNLIKTMQPLLDEFYIEKMRKIATIKNEIKEIRTRIDSHKNEMREMISQHKKISKTTKLLSRIDKIIESGLTYGSTKRELLIILKVLDKLSEERIDTQISEMMNILSRGINTKVS